MAKSAVALKPGQDAAMNRKQRVLTIIALIAFVVIGACHHLGWPPMEFHDSHQRAATLEEQVQRRKEYVQRYDEKSAKAADTIEYFKTVVYQEWHPHLMLDDPAIPDVRVPVFMLGVIYVGMFFLLADRKEKE